MLQKQMIPYDADGIVCEGYCVKESNTKTPKPAILIAHDWSGRNAFACEKAEQLASMGYIGFALDMYGNGRTGSTKEEKSALMQPFMQDRSLLLKRILAAYHAIKQLDAVDIQQIGAIGFCFGGLCVLDLARSGAPIAGVVSFHGLLIPPERQQPNRITAKVLALHGFDDPMVTTDHVMRFGEEMTKAAADWQLTMYGQTMHAFTNPEANDPGFGTVYNAKSATRAWGAMNTFFQDIFSSV